MTSNEAEIPGVSTGEGIQQIPSVFHVAAVPAAAEARDKLLEAIGQEAQQVAQKSAGQASKALEELARAYALVTTGTATAERAANTQPKATARKNEHGALLAEVAERQKERQS